MLRPAAEAEKESALPYVRKRAEVVPKHTAVGTKATCELGNCGSGRRKA